MRQLKSSSIAKLESSSIAKLEFLFITTLFGLCGFLLVLLHYSLKFETLKALEGLMLDILLEKVQICMPSRKPHYFPKFYISVVSLIYGCYPRQCFILVYWPWFHLFVRCTVVHNDPIMLSSIK